MFFNTMFNHQDATTVQRRATSSMRLVTWSLRALLLLLVVAAAQGDMEADTQLSWQRAGCHQVGFTRRISLPGCVEFDVLTNACRGFCESYSVPSSEDVLRLNNKHLITSYGQCCDIVETEDVRVRVMCVNGPRELLFKSAKSCSCFHCKKQ